MTFSQTKIQTLFCIATLIPTGVVCGQNTPEQSLPDILTVLPSDTQVALIIPKLQWLNDRWGPLFAQWGLPSKPLDALQNKLEMVTGLDHHRGAAIAILKASNQDDPSLLRRMVLILPTLNRNALLTFLSPESLEDGYVKVRLRERNSYAGSKGAYTIIGPTLDAVRRVVESKAPLQPKLSRNQTFHYSRGDAAVWLGKNSITFLEELRSAQTDNSILAQVINLYGSDIENLISLRVEQEGLTVKACIHHPTSDTNLPTKFNSPLLLGIPHESVVLAGGVMIDNSSQRLQRWISHWFRQVQSQHSLPPPLP